MSESEHFASKGTRIQLRTIPVVRIFGMGFIWLLAFLNLCLSEPSAALAPLLPLGLLMTGYSLCAWVLMQRFFLTLKPWVNLGEIFLYLDVPIWAMAIYVAGAERCWFSWIVLMRAADHANSSFRRVAMVTHWVLLSYLGTFWLAERVVGHPVDWASEIGRQLLYYTFGMYLAVTARTAERLRARTRKAVHDSQALIEQLAVRNQELAAAQASAEQASQVKSHFLSMMSHELRTPLNAILGFSELLATHELTAKQKSYVEHIHSSGERLLSLSTNLLDVVQLKTGQIRLEPMHVDAMAILHRVLAIKEDAIHAGSLKLSWDLRAASTFLWADPARLEQILYQLVDNAVKFSPTASSITLSLVQTEANLEIFIQDCGPGLLAADLERIFTELEQIDFSYQRAHEGAGLGLAIARRLARLMGGEISVTSQPGVGSLFCLSLPYRFSPGS